MDTLSPEIFAARRAALRARLGPDAVALAANPDPAVRSADSTYPYRPNSNVLYLTGFPEPGAVAVVLPEGAEREFVLFVPPRDPEKEQWTGRRAGTEGALERYGADAAFALGDIDDELPALLDAPSLYVDWDAKAWRERVFELTHGLRTRKRHHRGGPSAIHDLAPITGALRCRKSPEELDVMRRAAHISTVGHLAAAETIRPGVPEYVVEAAINHAFRRAGAVGPAYESIVGAGVNATILHYVENADTIAAGDAVLVDAGAEYAWYAGDITRTYPASGRFSAEQRALYEIVLAAELAAIDEVRLGRHFRSPHERALEVLVDGLIELRLLEGSRDEVIESESYKRFFMHSTSHFLGLDTHDVGAYYLPDDTPVPLEAGMVLTVEPGLYIGEDDDTVPEAFRGIGIRIEDDVVVTDDAPENLTHAAPKALEDIER